MISRSFTVRTGPSKVTKVREIKYRDEYAPAVDFWRHMRDGIVQLHRRGAVDRRSLGARGAASSRAFQRRRFTRPRRAATPSSSVAARRSSSSRRAAPGEKAASRSG